MMKGLKIEQSIIEEEQRERERERSNEPILDSIVFVDDRYLSGRKRKTLQLQLPGERRITRKFVKFIFRRKKEIIN